MNSIERQIDQLVDGELSEDQRRELLARLDQQPDGWRRCALAFLEAQCWRETLGPVALRPMEAPAEPRPASRSSCGWAARYGVLAAVAASFLLAFVLGVQFRQGWFGGVVPPAEMVKNAPEGAAAVPEVRQAQVAVAPPQPERDVQPDPRRWQLVTLTTPEGPEGGEETIRVPAVESDAVDEQWLANQPPAVPREVLEAFQRAGHRVQQQRELVPVQLKDGRRLVVPVDRVELNYVGRPAL